jgi:hypothetical protein
MSLGLPTPVDTAERFVRLDGPRAFFSSAVMVSIAVVLLWRVWGDGYGRDNLLVFQGRFSYARLAGEMRKFMRRICGRSGRSAKRYLPRFGNVA